MQDAISRRLALSLALFSLIALGSASTARADEIQFVSPTQAQGTGFGTVLTILTLHQTPNEVGSVAWNGATTVTTGDATNQSATYSLNQLLAAGFGGASSIGIVFNINETGPVPNSAFLNSMTLNLHNNVTGAVVYSVSLRAQDAGDDYPMFEQGVGGSGYLFILDANAANSLQAFFASNPDFRLGMSGNVGSTDNGPDTFYLVNVGTPVPEPASMLLLGSGLVGVAMGIRKRVLKR